MSTRWRLFLIEDSGEYLNLGDTPFAVFTELDETELPVLLAKDLDYDVSGSGDGEYDQEFTLSSEMTFSHIQDSRVNDKIPFLGYEFSGSNDFILNYTANFGGNSVECNTNFAKCDNTRITFMDREFYVLDVSTTSNGVKMDLFDAGDEYSLGEGDETTVTIDGVDYTLLLNNVKDADPDECYFDYEGSVISLEVGETDTLEDDVYLGVTDAIPGDSSTGTCYFAIGSGKITLEHGQDVKVNTKTVTTLTDYKLKSYITNSTTDIDKIELEWIADKDMWMMEGSEFTMPAFETVKLWQGATTFPGEEISKVFGSGDDVIKFTGFDQYGEVTFGLLYRNESNATAYIGLGDGESERLVTTSADSIIFDDDLDDYAVISWDDGDDKSESTVIYLTVTDEGDNETIIYNVADDDDLASIEIGNDATVGNIKITVNSAHADDNYANISIESNRAGENVYFDRFYTEEGLRMMLPVVSTTATGDGIVNISGNSGAVSHVVNFTEENYDLNVAAGDLCLSLLALVAIVNQKPMFLP